MLPNFGRLGLSYSINYTSTMPEGEFRSLILMPLGSGSEVIINRIDGFKSDFGFASDVYNIPAHI